MISDHTGTMGLRALILLFFHAFHDVVLRFEAQRLLEVEHEEVTIEQMIGDIRKRFLVHNTLLFSAFFAEIRSKRRMIVVFLALLELVRLHEIWLYQKKSFDEIHISKVKETA